MSSPARVTMNEGIRSRVISVPCTAPIERARQEGDDDRRPPRPVGRDGLHELHGDDRPHGADVADRQVDLAEQQREGLGHGQHHEHRALLEEVHDVAGGEEDVMRADDLEDDDDDDQPQDDGEHPALSAPDAEQLAVDVLPHRLGDDLGRDERGRRRRRAVGSTAVSTALGSDTGGAPRRWGRGQSWPWSTAPARLRGPLVFHAQAPGGHVLDDALAVEGRRLVLDHDRPQVQHGDAVGHGEDVVEVVRDHQHGQAVVSQASDQVEHHAPSGSRRARRWARP